MIKYVLHASGVACFGYALYYEFMHVHVPAHLATNAAFVAMKSFPGKWKYLTIWDIVLQLVYHSVALVNDFAGTSEIVKKRQSPLQRFRDGFFASWAFPVGLFVGVTFWGMFFVDREMVFPAFIDTYFPVWLNHALHTAPPLIVLCESVLVFHSYPHRLLSISILTGGVVVYLSWITYVHSQSGVWAYPILQVLNNAQRGVFFGGCTVAIISFYFLGEKLNKLRWIPGVDDASPGKVAGKAKNAGKGKKKTKLT